MKWSSWHIDGREVFFRVPDVLLWWEAVSNWNLMQRLSFYTKSICSCWASALGQSPPQTMLKSFSTDLTHRKLMHLRQKTHKRVRASWWTLGSVRSAVSLRQAAPESSWIRTVAVHLEPLTETGDCVTACQGQILLLDILCSDEVQIPVQPIAVLVTCAYCTLPLLRDELWKQKEMSASEGLEQELCSS